MSARAAWRLISLGFTNVFRYKPGKADWMANGLPVKGEEAKMQHAGDLARQDVPVCRLGEQIAEILPRLQKAGWDACVVTNEDRVVLGLLGSKALQAGPQTTAEQAMESSPRTYRLDTSLEKIMKHFQDAGSQRVLVTTADGILHGLLRREDVEKALSASKS